MGASTRTWFLFVVIFTISGFSGLIYESIWSHYLKLLLGHASYAQVLVLTIFMGGMAIGSAIAARVTEKLSNLLLCYGIVEGVVGIAGVFFHSAFIETHDFIFYSLIPELGSPVLASTIKWGLSALLVLPQSILLGLTFPFLAAGLIRVYGASSGSVISTLYFANSFGAAIGVLFNSFVLIPNIGLPGAILFAGTINILLALVVYISSKRLKQQRVKVVKAPSIQLPMPVLILLVVSGLTGFASFLYEIGWIRMLTMVLGGSSHSFEIMLSAFILGLAIGGLYIRKRLDRIDNPIKYLAYIQILMAFFALFTIPLYDYLFEFMDFFVKSLRNNDSGYLVFSFVSYGLSLILMLPATIMAGMTLPIITHALINSKIGEPAIGKVYAWNTFGGILGIAVAINIVMPVFGLKNVIVFGALVDIILGFVLIFYISKSEDIKFKFFKVAGVVSLFVGVSLSDFDLNKMASGVFRYGLSPGNYEVIFHNDGKSSTVAVREKDGLRMILNNGKPDAGIVVSSGDSTDTYSADEPTMILLGTIPYIYRKDAKYVANIGLGSGMTAHQLLHNKDLERLDTIEIEESVYQAAQFFGEKVENIFKDHRSHIHIDDAKTFFSTKDQKYDVIISEPPNPWVSGVSSLFSTEFYRDVKMYLSGDGVFVQWMHFYEMNPELVSTVYQALRENFLDISMFQVSNGDVVITASDNKLVEDYSFIFQDEKISKALSEIKIHNKDDLLLRKMGDGKKLESLFSIFGTNSNSDYFPILDVGAGKARFKSETANSLFDAHYSFVLNDLFSYEDSYIVHNVSVDPYLRVTVLAEKARMFYDALDLYREKPDKILMASEEYQFHAVTILNVLKSCNNSYTDTDSAEISKKILNSLFWVSEFSRASQLYEIIDEARECDSIYHGDTKVWLDVMNAWNIRDFKVVHDVVMEYFAGRENLSRYLDKQLLIFYLGSVVALGEWEDVSGLYLSIDKKYRGDMELMALFQLLGVNGSNALSLRSLFSS